MAQQMLNIGSTANDGTGDTLRAGGNKINDNFSELYAIAAGLGTASALTSDTDATLAANSNTRVATQAAVKAYVDAKVAGLSWKQAVRAATTAAGTLASDFENGDTLDGVTLATGDRILLKNQSSASENGIYVVAASGAPTRATDADAGAELVNASIYVSEGTANADTQWTCTTNAPITLGSTSLAFAQLTSGGGVSFASAADYQGGTDTTKALNSDKVWEAAEHVTLADGAIVTPDFGAGINFKWAIGGNRTLANPSNAKKGQTGCIEITQDGTGGRTISWGSNYRFAGGTDIALSTSASAIDLIFYYVTDDLKIFVSAQKAVAA